MQSQWFAPLLSTVPFPNADFQLSLQSVEADRKAWMMHVSSFLHSGLWSTGYLTHNTFRLFCSWLIGWLTRGRRYINDFSLFSPSSFSVSLFPPSPLTLSYLPVSPHPWWWSESRSHLLPGKSSAALLPSFCLLTPLLGPRWYLYLSIHPSIHPFLHFYFSPVTWNSPPSPLSVVMSSPFFPSYLLNSNHPCMSSPHFTYDSFFLSSSSSSSFFSQETDYRNEVRHRACVCVCARVWACVCVSIWIWMWAACWCFVGGGVAVADVIMIPCRNDNRHT